MQHANTYTYRLCSGSFSGKSYRPISLAGISLVFIASIFDHRVYQLQRSSAKRSNNNYWHVLTYTDNIIYICSHIMLIHLIIYDSRTLYTHNYNIRTWDLSRCYIRSGIPCSTSSYFQKVFCPLRMMLCTYNLYLSV